MLLSICTHQEYNLFSLTTRMNVGFKADKIFVLKKCVVWIKFSVINLPNYQNENTNTNTQKILHKFFPN